ncbi:hypothetical protein HYPBUDRAFT_110803 [Hyphopichia burtonii NRRL Y-1933]|uniref:Uncharacterized protein n=1 Tax=Hyphopichia burtonii NRRL Y-1933 TaxID=984485 RepID=A0A1E4RHN3_9ASCO|nr:hypothetical protein HYPBUDRAFT_110803 [Hyphopichia burtonii NRRL Y-1933]ODV66760.1 hypothetical protein HYPBUDRAFT_110803 [Hyphopichia burtonii NRRL Y-1933]
MSLDRKDLINEMSLADIANDPSRISDAHITQVSDFIDGNKYYLFYIYFDASDYRDYDELFRKYIDDYSKNGVNTPNLYHNELYIIRGVHELISIWEINGYIHNL